MGIENKLICLSLNANWQPIGYRTVKAALIDLCGSPLNKPTCKALHIDYATDDEGNPIYDSPTQMIPCDWNEWIKLEVKPWDLSINTTNSKIKIPTVTIAWDYNRMNTKKVRNTPSNNDIFIRDKGIDQYTGKKIPKSKGSVDHIVPRKLGGTDDWNNLVYTSKELNSKKGHKENHECNLKLIREPFKPKEIPMNVYLKDIKHPSWKFFIKK